MTVKEAENFDKATINSPARGLLKTAPHVFTDRGYDLKDIETILDSYAYRGINLSYGTFRAAMDLADAQWKIISDVTTESTITITDRLCFEIPKTEKAETEAGKALLEKYWGIYEKAKERPGIKQGKEDKTEGVVNMNALRSELNAFRGTYTCYSFKNTENIEDDVNNLWLPPVRATAQRYRNGVRASGVSEQQFILI